MGQGLRECRNMPRRGLRTLGLSPVRVVSGFGLSSFGLWWLWKWHPVGRLYSCTLIFRIPKRSGETKNLESVIQEPGIVAHVVRSIVVVFMPSALTGKRARIVDFWSAKNDRTPILRRCFNRLPFSHRVWSLLSFRVPVHIGTGSTYGTRSPLRNEGMSRNSWHPGRCASRSCRVGW